VNPNVVVVLSNGGVVTVSGWQHQARAVLECWLAGQASGAAVADLLLGAVSPSGKLAETIPVSLEHNPTVGNFPGENGSVRYGEGLLIGYRWYDAHRLEVSYPFGHGLSYTSFAYRDIDVEVLADDGVPRVRVAFTIANTGDRVGTEIAQLYVTDRAASVYRPEQELRGFVRVELAPGASQRVELELGARAFAYWHAGRGDWAVAGGQFELRAGASSRDVRLTATITLAGSGNSAGQLGVDSAGEEFLAHEDARDWLIGLLENTELGARLFDPQHGRMMRDPAVASVPLSRCAVQRGHARRGGQALLEGSGGEHLTALPAAVRCACHVVTARVSAASAAVRSSSPGAEIAPCRSDSMFGAAKPV